MVKAAIPITPQYKLSGGAWATIPTVVTGITTNRTTNIARYNPINSTAPSIVKLTASPIITWELTGICTKATHFNTVEATLAPGRTASFKCSTATPAVPIIVTDLRWEEVAGQVNIYRFTLSLEKTS